MATEQDAVSDRGSRTNGVRRHRERRRARGEWCQTSAAGRERCSELAARGDAELSVDAREVHFERLQRYEERLRDVLVRVIGGCEFGDTALARRQRLDAREHDCARAGAGRGDLVVSGADERARPCPERPLDALAEELASLGTAVATAQGRPE